MAYGGHIGPPIGVTLAGKNYVVNPNPDAATVLKEIAAGLVQTLQRASPPPRARLSFPARVHRLQINQKGLRARVRYLRGYNSHTD